MTATQTQHKVVSRNEWLRRAGAPGREELTEKRRAKPVAPRLPWIRSKRITSSKVHTARSRWPICSPAAIADHLHFHARPLPGRRMQVLLFPGGPLRPPAYTWRTATSFCGGFRADAADESVSKRMGWRFHWVSAFAAISSTTTVCTLRRARRRRRLQLRRGGSGWRRRPASASSTREAGASSTPLTYARGLDPGGNISLPRPCPRHDERTRVHHGMGPAPR
jgi:hypothetical protein